MVVVVMVGYWWWRSGGGGDTLCKGGSCRCAIVKVVVAVEVVVVVFVVVAVGVCGVGGVGGGGGCGSCGGGGGGKVMVAVVVFHVFQHFLYIQRGCKLSEGFSAPKNRHRIKNKLYSESCVYRKGRNPASYVLRLLELYARMHLVNYKKKSNLLSRDMD